MSQTPFRSVQLKASQAEGLSNLKAPDRSKQTAELARQQNQQRQNLQTVIGLQQNLASRSQDTVSEIEFNNQRLIQAQLSNNKELAFKAREMRQRQGLADEKMLADFDSQILNLKNAQQITADQIKQQQNISRDSAITNLGESFLQFSSTLVEQRAEATNQANRQIMAGAMLDGFLSQLNTGTPELDSAQDARVAANLTLSQAANEDEAAGRDNDATELRSNNGFYAYGYAEGIALKAASNFSGYLQKRQEEFEKQMPFGKPNAYLLQQSFIRKATEDFIDQNNLTSIPPQVLNKYFARTALSAQAEIVRKFNNENKKYVKDAGVSRAIGDLRTAAFPFQSPGVVFNREVFAADINKQLHVLIQSDPLNAEANIKAAFDSLAADAVLGKNLDPLKTFVDVLDANPYLRQFANKAFDEYPEVLKRTEKAIKQERKEQSAENLAVLQLKLLELDDVTDPTTRNQKLEAIEAQGAVLTAADQVKLGNALQDTSIINKEAAIETNERFLLSNPSPEEIRNFAELYKNRMGIAQYNALLKNADDIETREGKDPATKRQFEQAKQRIASLKPTISLPQLQKDGLLRERINQAVRARRDEFDKNYSLWVRSDSNVTFEQFLKQNKYLLEDAIQPSEYEPGSGQLPVNQQPGIKKEPIPSNPSKSAEFYSRPTERSIARSGGYGELDPDTHVYLEAREVADLVGKYENGTTTSLLRDLSRAAGVSPRSFLRSQATLLDLPGTVEDPKPETYTQERRGFMPNLDSSNFFAQKGLRAVTADTLAQIVVIASQGNPSLAATQRGLFDFGEQDKNALYEFGQSTSRDPVDPYTQLEYVYQKIQDFSNGTPQQKAHYAILTSTRPDSNQLRNALKALFPAMDNSLIDRAIYNMRSN
tara:strand:+ start:898 stop:3546 length:2649 start_codon:yes stop_codon:yes gene_type:complete